MPKYREIFIKKDARIVVWKITESEEELIELIQNPEHLSTLSRRKSASSRKQFLATRIILKLEGVDNYVIKDENGKPILPSGHLSISHDSNYVAVMFSKDACGIDLQSVTPKVLRVKHKFIDEEDRLSENGELVSHTIAWCLKEAIYKIHGDPMVYFKEHIRILSCTPHLAHIKVLHADYLKDVTLEIQKIDELYLAYTI